MFGISLLQILVVIGSITAGYFYVENLQHKVEVYAQNQIKLEESVKQQKITITEMEKKTSQIVIETTDLQKRFNMVEEESHNLSIKLSTIDLNKEGLENPEQLQILLNKGTENFLQEFKQRGKK